jgi:hypothetical protein
MVALRSFAELPGLLIAFIIAIPGSEGRSAANDDVKSDLILPM